MRGRIVTPREAALAILHAWFGVPATGQRGTLPLTGFQRQAVDRLRQILERWHGAVLADAVGLGKTYVALSLIEAALRRGQAVIIVVPAALRRHWQRHLRKLPAPVRGAPTLVTHTALSFGRVPAVEPAFVVVDEAHAFRNPRTRRYEALQRMIGPAHVLLLSATPVNNSLDDLQHIIRLFAQPTAFHEFGVADLREVFRRAPTDARAQRMVQQIIDAVVVRRTRTVVAGDPTDAPGQALHLRFAERAPPRSVRYDLMAAYGTAWPDIYRALQRLTFAAASASAGGGAAELMRLQMLKRLESSVTAFALSLKRQAQLCDLMLNGLRNGRWIEPAALRSLIHDLEVGTQLPVQPLLARSLPRELDAQALTAALCADRELFRLCSAALPNGHVSDPKLDVLHALLRQLGAGAIVFTQYRDTAIHLWRRLQRTVRVGLVHGTDARLGAQRAARSTVIECFAPHANGVRPPSARLRVDVLIATDVLSEGLNLQDAHTVVSYDIPWNPVTLMQRLGRVDRLGSPHASVQLCNFLPDRGLDEWLNLVERVERKLQLIQRTMGGDGHLLELPEYRTRETVALASDPAAATVTALAQHEQIERLRARWLRQAQVPGVEEPVVSSLPGDTDGWLIAVQDGTVMRLLFVDAHDNVRDDVGAACRLVNAALDCQCDCCTPHSAVPWTVVRRWLTDARAAHAISAEGHSEGRQLTRLLLNALAAAPAHARLLRRAERVLDLLGGCSYRIERTQLRSLVAQYGPHSSAAQMVAGLEALCADAREARRAPHSFRPVAAIEVIASPTCRLGHGVQA
jgi:hypothetical protein